jgi:hypothetical protein
MEYSPRRNGKAAMKYARSTPRKSCRYSTSNYLRAAEPGVTIARIIV